LRRIANRYAANEIAKIVREFINDILIALAAKFLQISVRM